MNGYQEIFHRLPEDDLIRIIDQIHAFQPPVNPYLKLKAYDIHFLLNTEESDTERFWDDEISKNMDAAFKAHLCDLKMILEIRDVLNKMDISKFLSVCGYDQLYIENENGSEPAAKCFCTTEISERNQKSFKWVIIKVNKHWAHIFLTSLAPSLH